MCNEWSALGRSLHMQKWARFDLGMIGVELIGVARSKKIIKGTTTTTNKRSRNTAAVQQELEAVNIESLCKYRYATVYID